MEEPGVVHSEGGSDSGAVQPEEVPGTGAVQPERGLSTGALTPDGVPTSELSHRSGLCSRDTEGVGFNDSHRGCEYHSPFETASLCEELSLEVSFASCVFGTTVNTTLQGQPCDSIWSVCFGTTVDPILQGSPLFRLVTKARFMA